jgi:DNA-directed RNA polymerase specialized sigma24 family protein
MVHALGWTHTETAELLGLSTSSVQRHVERGLKKLRTRLGVDLV